jgi:hypothetical protein
MFKRLFCRHEYHLVKTWLGKPGSSPGTFYRMATIYCPACGKIRDVGMGAWENIDAIRKIRNAYEGGDRMPGFCTPNQVKQIIKRYLDDTGRGGYQRGEVTSVSPLKIKLNDKIEISEASIDVTDSAIGLHVSVPEHGTATLRDNLKIGDGVLLITQPRADGKQRYVLLDRMQPYTASRTVST